MIVDRLCSCDVEFLADYRYTNTVFHQDVTKAARDSYRPGDLEQVAAVAGKLWGCHLRAGPRCRRWIGLEEHAMKACIQ